MAVASNSLSAISLGRYLADRLGQLGLGHYFAVPGDYNLVLLDQLLTRSDLTYVGCCNELNAGYAADGYARARGVAAVVVTFSVGSLSVLNAIAGASAEDLPVVVIAGGPSTRAKAESRHLHHTQGGVEYGYCRDIFRHITADSVILNSLEDGPALIDRALTAAMTRRQPVYIEVPCDLAGLPVSQPGPLDFARPAVSDPASLAAAVAGAAAHLNSSAHPVLVAGSKLRRGRAIRAFRDLADALSCAVAVMPDAKSFFPESHPNYIGHYWGPVSSPGCAGVVESADAYLFAGALFTDYTTAGYSLPLDRHRLIHASAEMVTCPTGTFTGIGLADFLSTLAQQVRKNTATADVFRRGRPQATPPTPFAHPEAVLTRQALMMQIQDLLDPTSVVVAETGDSWFNAVNLRLPDGADFEIQMTYGSIGWSVGATLGLALGHGPTRQVIALIGDGSFQLTAQEVATMIGHEIRPIIFLINNRGYTIEVEIHDGPYNNIPNWDYAGLMGIFSQGAAKGLGFCVNTVGDLTEAIARAQAHDGPCLIECSIDRDDCTEELRAWGVRVAAFNGRGPTNS